jgi:hypothetical protein
MRKWTTRMLIALLSASAFLAQSALAASTSHKVKAQKQAVPAQGNKSEQAIEASAPLCDAYLPYKISGQTITQIFPSATPPETLPTDNEINQFLNSNFNVATPISKDGSFVDPGYPILGNPDRHLYSNASDITRLLARLLYTVTPGTISATSETISSPVSLCKAGEEATENVASNAIDQHPSDYYLIHIVRWKRSGGSYVTSHSDWYIFNRDDGQGAHRQVPFRFHPYVSGDLRILGNNKVLFVAVHLAPSPCDPTDANCEPSQEYDNFRKYVAVSYKMVVSHVEPANIQDLKALIGVITNATPPSTVEARAIPNPNLQEYKKFLSSSGKRPYVGVFAAATLTNLQNLPVQITATMNVSLQKVEPKLPDVDQYKVTGFWDKLGASQGTQVSPGNAISAKNQTSTTSAANGTTPSGNNQVAAGCSTSGTNGKCSENVVVSNEGLYRWDFSVGVPFKGIKQLQYNSTSNGAVTPQTVSKGNAYGFLVLAPWKEDIVTPPTLGIPHLLVGLPFSGKVFDSPFFGAGETFNLSKIPKIGNSVSKIVPVSIRFYSGIVYLKQFGPVPAASGTAPVPQPPSHRVAKLQYGVEFSVREIVSKLTGGKSSTTKSTPKTSSGGG